MLTGSVPLVLMKLNLSGSIDPGVLGAVVLPEFACFHFTYRPAGVTVPDKGDLAPGDKCGVTRAQGPGARSGRSAPAGPMPWLPVDPPQAHRGPDALCYLPGLPVSLSPVGNAAQGVVRFHCFALSKPCAL